MPIFSAFCLLLAVMGLPCCTTFSSCGEWGLLSLPSAAPRCSGVSRQGAPAPERGLSGRSLRAQLPLSLWDLPGPGVTPVSPALAGRFLTTAAERSPLFVVLNYKKS